MDASVVGRVVAEAKRAGRSLPAKAEPEEDRRAEEPPARGIEEFAMIAPVHGDPGLDPVTTPWDVAKLAGWGGGIEGHDSLEGVDRMLLGEVDATAELMVGKGPRDPGPPLEVAFDETIMGVGGWPPADDDWCDCLAMDDADWGYA